MPDYENLPATTPFMLRDDGVLLKCGDIHPYIFMSVKSSLNTNLKTLNNHLDFLEWFYKNTLQKDVKTLIDKYKQTKDTSLLSELNTLTNNEFCRVRTSNYKVPYGGNNGRIYFRISSNNGFNWFDAIYNTILKYDNLDYVTVVKDAQAFKDVRDFDYYKIGGKEINRMPIEEFLTLLGNPILESKESLTEKAKSEEGVEMKDLKETPAVSGVKSNGIYSVMNSAWIKEPVKEDIPEVDHEAFEKLFKEWEDKYFDLINKVGGESTIDEPEDDVLVEDLEDEDDLDVDWEDIPDYNKEFADQIFNMIDSFIEKEDINESFQSKNSLDHHFKKHCLAGSDKQSKRSNVFYDFVRVNDYSAREREVSRSLNSSNLLILNSLGDPEEVATAFRKLFEGNKSLLLSQSCGFNNNNRAVAILLHAYASDATTNYLQNTIDFAVIRGSITYTLYPVDANYLERKLNNIIKKYAVDVNLIKINR